jgi:hypothetical protein
VDLYLHVLAEGTGLRRNAMLPQQFSEVTDKRLGDDWISSLCERRSSTLAHISVQGELRYNDRLSADIQYREIGLPALIFKHAQVCHLLSKVAGLRIGI